MKILLACANSRSRPLSGADREIHTLGDFFHSKNISIVKNSQSSLSNISQNFLDNPRNIAVLHYCGHANSKAIELWEDTESGLNKNAYAGGFAQFIGTQNCVRVVFLNGCSSEGQAKEFINHGAKAVIATSMPVKDKIAEDFALHFYKVWVSGKSLGEAFTAALGLINANAQDWKSLNRGVIFDEDELNPDLDKPTYTIYPSENSGAPILKATLRELLNGYNPPSKLKEVFVLYAEEDKPFHDEIYKQLKPMERKGVIRWNSSDTVTFEASVDDQITAMMEKAEIILLLISSSFFASAVINGTHMEIVHQRHQENTCVLIPILLYPSDYSSSSIGGLRSLPRNGIPVGRPDNYDALNDIREVVKIEVEKER